MNGRGHEVRVCGHVRIAAMTAIIAAIVAGLTLSFPDAFLTAFQVIIPRAIIAQLMPATENKMTGRSGGVEIATMAGTVGFVR